MAVKREGYIILESYDDELDMRIQFHYWIAGKYFYRSVEREDGVTEGKKRISESDYISALESYYNA